MKIKKKAESVVLSRNLLSAIEGEIEVQLLQFATGNEL